MVDTLDMMTVLGSTTDSQTVANMRQPIIKQFWSDMVINYLKKGNSPYTQGRHQTEGISKWECEVKEQFPLCMEMCKYIYTHTYNFSLCTK